MLEAKGFQLRNGRVPLPDLPLLDEHGGWTVEGWLTLFHLSPGQKLFDSRSAPSTGITLTTAGEASLALEVGDGPQRAVWHCARNSAQQ